MSLQLPSGDLPTVEKIQSSGLFGNSRITRKLLKAATDDQLCDLLIELGCSKRDVYREDSIKRKRRLLIDWVERDEERIRQKEAAYPALRAELAEQKRVFHAANVRIGEIERQLPRPPSPEQQMFNCEWQGMYNPACGYYNDDEDL